MRAPRARRVRVLWPEGATNLFPATIGAVFEGDTVVASATFDRDSVDGTVTLEVETSSGEVFRHALTLPALHDAREDGAFAPANAGPDTTIARVCAALRLRTLDARAGLATALRHRLMSPWTNYLVIAERAEGEKADGMPALRKVPQTVAAGWHGLGSVLNVRASRASVDSDAMCISPAIFAIVPDDDPRPVVPSVQHADLAPVAFPAIRERLFELIEDDPRRLDTDGLRTLLHATGLASELADLFVLASELGIDEDSLAMIVVARFAACDDGDLSPDAQAAFDALRQRAEEALKALRALRDCAKSLRAIQRRTVRMRILRRFHDDDTSVKVEELAALIARLEGVNRGSITVPPTRASEAASMEVERF
jgi:hypothetical protein